MKNLKKIIIIPLIVTLFIFVKCSKETDTEKSPVKKINFETLSFNHSMKGWELYSWPNGNDWNYAILIGTNRVKSYEEVIANLIVCGKDSLKMVLDKFPEDEYIFWIGEGWLEKCWDTNYGNLSLPDSNIINEIKDYCIQKKVLLSISD